MTINKPQQRIVIVGALVIAAMSLFPPWLDTFKTNGTYSERPAGYSLIIHPPKPTGASRKFGIKLDISRFSLQFIAAFALTGAGLLLRTDK